MGKHNSKSGCNPDCPDWEGPEMTEPMTPKTQAERIFYDWFGNQLRPEGRQFIYTDDQFGLIVEIEKALQASRQEARALLEECRHLMDFYKRKARMPKTSRMDAALACIDAYLGGAK